MNSWNKKPIYLYLLLLTLCGSGGLQIWRTLFNNFAVDIAGLQGNQVGFIQGIREVPGFLSLLVVYVLLFIKEERLAAFSILVMGASLAATGFLPNYGGLICTTLVMSFGFHYFETVNQSLTLQHFSKEEAPLVFGVMRSRAAACSIVVGLFFMLAANYLSYQGFYLLFGGIIIAAALCALSRIPVPAETVPQRRGMVVRRRYWLFYLLTFLAGARRQIFVAFALFLLVEKFAFSLQEVAALILLNNSIGYFCNPLIGRAVAAFGERCVLSVEYISLFFIFLGYGFTESKAAAAILYIADHIVFNFALAIRTFFQKIADPADIAPSMAVGFTINHIAAVVVPICGGLLWLADPRLLFIGGAVLSLVSFAAVQYIPGQLAAASDGERHQ